MHTLRYLTHTQIFSLTDAFSTYTHPLIPPVLPNTPTHAVGYPQLTHIHSCLSLIAHTSHTNILINILPTSFTSHTYTQTHPLSPGRRQMDQGLSLVLGLSRQNGHLRSTHKEPGLLPAASKKSVLLSSDLVIPWVGFSTLGPREKGRNPFRNPVPAEGNRSSASASNYRPNCFPLEDIFKKKTLPVTTTWAAPIALATSKLTNPIGPK